METTKPIIIIKTPKEDQILIDRNIGYIKNHDSDSFIAACKRYEDCFMFGKDEYFKVLEEYPNDKIFTYITDELKYRKFHGRIFNAVKYSDFHEVTRLITEEKVDVHFFKDLATRLACIMNNKAMVDHLITFGADPSKIDHCIACAVDKYQDIDFIKYLQSLGCTITENELKRAWECKRYKDKTKRRKMLSYLSSQIKIGGNIMHTVYTIGKNDNKIHKILTKRNRCIFNLYKINTECKFRELSSIIGCINNIDDCLAKKGIELMWHSMLFDESNGGNYTTIYYSGGGFALRPGDFICIDNLDLYLGIYHKDKDPVQLEMCKLEYVRSAMQKRSYTLHNFSCRAYTSV